jgi:secreted trypsin-like serine protease
LSQKAVFDESGSCFGDSGGPVFWVHPDTGQETIVAVTSSGDGQCVATGFNYRVDQPYMLQWVQEQILAAQ